MGLREDPAPAEVRVLQLSRAEFENASDDAAGSICTSPPLKSDM